MNDLRIKKLLRDKVVGRHNTGERLGLYFRVSEEGTGTWVVRFKAHSKRREITIGRYGSGPGGLSLRDARMEAAKIQAESKNGIDPLAERERDQLAKANTIDDLAADWLEDCRRRLKHPHIPERVYRKEISPAIGQLSLDQVNARDIRGIILKIAKSGRPTIANDALAYCKQLFNHGIKLDLVQSNPAQAFRNIDAGGAEESRDRALSLEEVERVFIVFRENTDQFTRDNYLAVALLLCLGVRKGELIAAEWSEVDLEEGLWVIPKHRSKNGDSITIPLVGSVIEWFQELKYRSAGSEYVFPRRRISKRNGHISPDTLNAAIAKLFREGKLDMPHFTVHDLRRTFRTQLGLLGVPGHVAERCMNHRIPGIERTYNVHDYFDERKEALEKVNSRIATLVSISKA
ncbi:tyrosine-type recombinase/integrase [Neptunomonas japonica]|uniref:Integrase n=1 Tax=Neptunomonas japonica JAMM 1380 TaxID=1441457 RepID=A0A7R6SY43_9GAMM|nr:site-specific integrase [Neptunomonas japonica]BBB31500.1 integrase [Neptunomonas japonica JAMM 1380]